ncbi:MAG: hypothetical protein JWR84_2847 [Caulobacter sp.]|nr:hypothetical protein [Caulobacter sp.]
MPSFTTPINLSTLDGTTGFRVDGVAGFDYSGYSVSNAGDVNGDGIGDFIIGAYFADPPGSNTGNSYVVFGRTGAVNPILLLSSLNGTNGFRLTGTTNGDMSARSVSSAGDVNGDGYDDLIIGADGSDIAGNASGTSYVVFGHAGAFAASIPLGGLNGTTGFSITGVAASDSSGWDVASAGDVNNDGWDDLIIGAWGADNNALANSGSAYVVFGHAGVFASTLSLSSLNGTNGFRLDGVAANDEAGRKVSSAGDVNGDGFADLLVGAFRADPNGNNSGAAYVVFGKASGFGASLALSTLDGTNGFRLAGGTALDYTAFGIDSAGDVNGDGYDDMIVGAKFADTNGNTNGVTYVVFGKALGFTASLNLTGLDGTNGFRIHGGAQGDYSGRSVAGAGDVNGDGFDDMLIGSHGSDVNGDRSGSAFLLFGKATWSANTFLNLLTTPDGVRFNGVNIQDFAGYSVSGAGDVNGDGVADILIGAYKADPTQSGAGSSYVIFGRQIELTRTGGGGSETLNGASADDQLSGNGGNDFLYGFGGDDVLDGGDLSDQLFGGDGADDLVGGAGGDILTGGAGADQLSGGDGADKLFGGLGSDELGGGAGNDRINGEDDIDTLTGGGGNDLLDGGVGADVMTGGTENDIYIVDNALDQTIELAGEGFDIVRTDFDGWVLSDNIEGLELQGVADIDGSGNSGANNIQGNAGGNTLSGLAGVDTINGNDGNDIVIGGEGNDLLRGGLGLDSFVVAHAFGATLETDQVFDFQTAEGDLVDLSGAFAGTVVLVGAFTRHAGEMTLTFAAGITTLRLDTTGDGRTDYQMKINGDVTADSGGWLL